MKYFDFNQRNKIEGDITKEELLRSPAKHWSEKAWGKFIEEETSRRMRGSRKHLPAKKNGGES
ncbi:hypothetical protein LCGC14_2867340 [marine sediment metagenome]|uniref:Uncharacterized protein n=1 Tax=marine sediment metagenome TaxID=412755 RepID=A0A0F9AC63_9ZZZZ